LLASRTLLRWAAGRAASTRAAEVGEMLLSMLRGEEGRQARELDELIEWLKQHNHPDVVCLSNALLVGMTRRLKTRLGTRVVCHLQGEDTFLDALPDSHRDAAWQLLQERCADVDLFIAPSRYFGDLMAGRLNLAPERVRVIHNGINLEGLDLRNTRARRDDANSSAAPVLGYFARMCKEKGLDTLVEAYIHLKNRGKISRLKLHIGGSCGPADEPFVKELRCRLAEAGYIGEVAFFPNLSRAEKWDFLRALSVFSVPARYGEAFGLYLIEAMAAGVPVVQPRTAAYPEVIESTGGGLLCEPGDPKSLAEAIEQLLLNPKQARALGEAGRNAIFERFNAEAMAKENLRVLEALT
jgi:glycosyltransferase involved in cell wall biosynthesis